MSFLKNLQVKKGKRWLLLFFAFILNFLTFIMIIFILEPYWVEINYTVSGWVDFNINIVLFVAIIVIIPLFYGIFLLFVHTKKILKTNEIVPLKIHKILPIALIVFYNILISLLLNELGSYVKLIGQVLEFYSVFIYLAISVCLILLLYPFFKMIPQLKFYLSEKFTTPNKKAIIILTCISVGYIIAFGAPLFFVPANVLYGDLPPKPDIIAHRGGAYLGPENTIEVAKQSLKYGIVGWEIDIQVSYDGVLFLMHDDTLTRTTNVEEIFPDRKTDDAETFKISELRELDAGSWYADNDPYGVIAQGIVTKVEAEKYRNIKIPTFKEVLSFTRTNGLYLDCDFKTPSEDHPYHDKFFEMILDAIIASGIDLKKVMIPSKDSTIISTIMFKGATDILTGYEYENTGDEYTNEEYRYFYRENHPVMVYTIDSVERFCQLWCLGVTWVKTNAPQKFQDLENPIIYMPEWAYYTIWIVVYIAAFCAAIVCAKKQK